MYHLIGGARESRQASERRRPLIQRNLVEECFHAFGLEHAARALDALSGLRKTQLGATSVDRAAGSRDVTRANEAVDSDRHRCRSHSHVASQIAKGGGIDGVEVVQNAGLVRAEKALSFWIADMSAMASEVDARIRIEKRLDVFGEPAHGRSIIRILCFVKAN